MAQDEVTVSSSSPMPPGYGFLEKGNVYMTGLCRRKTHAAGKRLYVVAQRHKTLGLRAPKWILHEVFKEERETRDQRRAAVEKHDDATKDEFTTAIQSQFPKAPADCVTQIVQLALKKRSGRVGRTGRLELESKVRLAVWAHLRHHHTNYDALLNAKTSKEKARKEVLAEVLWLQAVWSDSAPKKLEQAASSKRKWAREEESPWIDKKKRKRGNDEEETQQAADGRKVNTRPTRSTVVKKKDAEPLAESTSETKKKRRRNRKKKTKASHHPDDWMDKLVLRTVHCDKFSEPENTRHEPKREETPRQQQSLRVSTRSQGATLEMLDVFEDDTDEGRNTSDENDSDEEDKEPAKRSWGWRKRRHNSSRGHGRRRRGSGG